MSGPDDLPPPPGGASTAWMIGTTVLLALHAIRRHLLRSFLTVLGIVIGVFAVITMVTLGNGATQSVREQISSLGANTLTVVPGQGFGRGGGGQSPPPFKTADADAIRDQVAGLLNVAPIVTTSVAAVRNASNWSTTATGASDMYLDIESWAVTDGRRFTSAEEDAGKAVCLLGTAVRDKLYQEDNAVGTQLRLGGVTCEVIGVLATRGGGVHQDEDDAVVMPLKAVQRRFIGNQDIRAIIVAADPAYDSADIQNAIAALMRERRNIVGAKQDDFTIFDTRQIAQTLSGTTALLTAIVGAVAAISLLVGGIGIMNIMLVSVTERTREIGIRLAIGAIGREVMLQFLVEAVVLSCIGGLIGLVLALLACPLLARAFGIPFLFDPGVNLLAFSFSAVIGIVFGYFPARRAAALNPIDALRHE
jgi:putative ABC transport system permease protein